MTVSDDHFVDDTSWMTVPDDHFVDDAPRSGHRTKSVIGCAVIT